MRKFLFIALLPFSLFASSDDSYRRINAHLLVGDTHQAIKEAKEALLDYPEDPRLYKAALISLSEAGEESEMIAFWEMFHARFPEHTMEQEGLEQVCWSILRKGLKAPGITSHLISIIGAALTQDMYAVPFLLEGLRHTNAQIRSVSVQLSAHYGDHPLRDEIIRMFYTEQSLEVRLEVIKALSKLRVESVMPELMARISDPKIGAKEKSVIIQAVVNFYETIAHEELTILVKSQRAALRELACEVIAHLCLPEEASFLHQLVSDVHPDVQAAALKVMGVLRLPPSEQVKHLAQQSRDPTVGITASWVWLLADSNDGEKAIEYWLNHPNSEIQAKAASAIAAAGPYGTTLARTYLQKNHDPYVQANLALALIGQREACDQAGAVLEHLLATHDEKWMFAEEGCFHTLQKSTVGHTPVIPNFPEVVNQSVRLEILNLLAILEYPGAEDAIRQFLKKRHWGVTGLAAETLLGEGDETAIEHVRALLHDKDPHIQAEAALVLATWGRDPTALPYLLAAYSKGDRELKIKILEALGRIGDRATIPFLLERLKEPSLLLRMIAACILIQTLNA